MRILALLMLLWTTASFAEHRNIQPDIKQLPIQCGDSEHMVDGIREKYSEEIVMMAPSQNQAGHDLFHSLWINAGSTTWTFMIVNRNLGVACVMASGDQMKMFFPSGI